MRVFLVDSKGLHRFRAADLEHEGVVHTAVFSPDNNIIITCSQSESIQVRGEAFLAEVPPADPAHKLCVRSSKMLSRIPKNLPCGCNCGVSIIVPSKCLSLISFLVLVLCSFLCALLLCLFLALNSNSEWQSYINQERERETGQGELITRVLNDIILKIIKIKRPQKLPPPPTVRVKQPKGNILCLRHLVFPKRLRPSATQLRSAGSDEVSFRAERSDGQNSSRCFVSLRDSCCVY